MQTIAFERAIRKDEERTYFTLPFEVPEGIERLDIRYDYPRRVAREENGATIVEEINIVDLALTAGNGEYVGASGSDRTHIYISAYESAQGYAAVPISPGTWQIIVGAYKVAPEGVTVRYEITLTEKTLRRFQGDTHMHTTGSDGTLSIPELVDLCRKQRLDFAIITDHNNYSGNDHLPVPADMTVLPGAEWTHYNGHAGFLGVRRPYRSPFCVNTPEQARAQIEEARQAGAMIVVNHPFCHPECGWKWGFDLAPYDAVEIWNGPLMYENENTACLEWWHSQLCAGRRIPITGGSDFHRPEPMRLPGVPCTCLYAMSRSSDDLFGALRAGHGYVKMSPDMPDIDARAGEAMLGDVAPRGSEAVAHFTRLRGGDRIVAITDRGEESRACPPGGCEMTLRTRDPEAKFIRYEVFRTIARGLPSMRVMVSNPIYFATEV